MPIPALPFLTPKVAVVEVYGTIGAAVRTQQYVPALKALREDRRVRAVVLDIDSPGGSATATDYLYTELRKLAAKKPVVAFIRGIGASGAYFLAVGARRIIATRSSVVGSIGVITVRPVAQDLLTKIGVRVDVIKSGPLKGMGLPFVAPTPEETEKDRQMVMNFFDHFVRVVAEGRGVPEETVRGWATGEVYWGAEALERGMVDEIGDLDRATELAAQLAGIRERVSRVRPRKPALLQRVMGQASRTLARSVVMEIERALAPRIEYRWPGR
ncbi:MAG: signal peptide peptidase SppA [Dehalococcoidia bacterium]